MALAENPKPKAQVFKRPMTLEVRGEPGWEPKGDPVLYTRKGVRVGVVLDNQIVWSKEVYPFFKSLLDFGDVPRPRYSQRIVSAERKAQRIASKLG